jgi:hypothetical protein
VTHCQPGQHQRDSHRDEHHHRRPAMSWLGVLAESDSYFDLKNSGLG